MAVEASWVPFTSHYTELASLSNPKHHLLSNGFCSALDSSVSRESWHIYPSSLPHTFRSTFVMAFSILIKEICTLAAPGKYLCSSRSAGVRGKQGVGLLRWLLTGHGVATCKTGMSWCKNRDSKKTCCCSTSIFGFKIFFCLEVDFHWETWMGERFFVMSARWLCRHWTPIRATGI